MYTLQIEDSIYDNIQYNKMNACAHTSADARTLKQKILGDDIIDLTRTPKDTQAEDRNETIITPEIWNLMLMNSKNSPFKITPPHYNCFRQEKPHWLESPEVPWKTLNFSIAKCQEWLEEKCQE